MKKLHFLFLIVSVIFSLSLISPTDEYPPFLKQENTSWADSVFNSLTPDERIGQLFMVAAYSNRGKEHIKDIEQLILDYKIGGLIFFQGGPVRQAVLTNRYQALTKVPLLVSIDAEWGLAMRLDSTIQFPRQMTLGAIQNEQLIYDMGAEIARQCKRMGIHVNFAPVADVNSNPLNPVIGMRSFGEDKFAVTRKSLSYMKGMQDMGILANAKHFPGHGDTDSDSHKTLPTLSHSKEKLDSLELYPFKELMKHGLGSVMVAHLFIPAYDTTANTASTLSKSVVTDLLKNQLQFNGLIFTDALNMKGVSKFYAPGIVDVKALIAGNDVLLFAENVPTAIDEVKKAIEKGEITQEEIDARCRKILLVKQWTGLNNFKHIRIDNLWEDLNNPYARMLNRKLAEESVTLLINKNNLMPLNYLDTLTIASLSIGYKDLNNFQKTLGNYAAVTHFGIDKAAKKQEWDTLFNKLKNYNLVIININNTNNNPSKDFGLTPQVSAMINRLMKQSKVILNVLANPYVLSKLDSVADVDGLIMSYEANENSESVSAQLIFGGVASRGTLPVTASAIFKKGMGIQSLPPVRLKYILPEEIGIRSSDLKKIDSIALAGIREKAYPGCQILIAQYGKVFYQKSFGYHTYENKRAVKNTDLYDLASITKIAASLPAVMKLVEEKKLSLNGHLCYYINDLEGTNKENMVLKEMLTHQAGLLDWIPFWQKTVYKGVYKPGVYSKIQSDDFPYRVAEGLYMNKAYRDSIFKTIIESKLVTPGKYKYSDLGYYLIQQIIENQTGIPLDIYVRENFYKPIGVNTMTYKPRERFELSQIVPTEYDVKFRRQLVHGDVHDQGAAMLGGVAGHAGLFSNANDLAILMQMYLKKGTYGGQRYLDSTIINECTKCQYCISENRRGIGFDKPEMNPSKESPVCSCVSYLSYGHSGFTGTLTWVDPAKELVYVFLSNRVYPDAEINKLSKLNTRSKIQEVIYSVIK